MALTSLAATNEPGPIEAKHKRKRKKTETEMYNGSAENNVRMYVRQLISFQQNRLSGSWSTRQRATDIERNRS